MKLLTTSEAAEKLGVSERRVRQLINEGKLKAHKLRRDYAIEEDLLESVKTYGKAGRPSKENREKSKS
ncbi:MAG TPA: helix-turn-helix domain-containing protein [Pyrinomonadaceae bacterium]|nr:helix-turn-helix domain-containing protein [Pyrinomonadaceae bacterium]